jgi:hypothetical protein
VRGFFDSSFPQKNHQHDSSVGYRDLGYVFVVLSIASNVEVGPSTPFLLTSRGILDYDAWDVEDK